MYIIQQLSPAHWSVTYRCLSLVYYLILITVSCFCLVDYTWDDRPGSGDCVNAGFHALVCVPSQPARGSMECLQVISLKHAL